VPNHDGSTRGQTNANISGRNDSASAQRTSGNGSTSTETNRSTTQNNADGSSQTNSSNSRSTDYANGRSSTSNTQTTSNTDASGETVTNSNREGSATNAAGDRVDSLSETNTVSNSNGESISETDRVSEGSDGSERTAQTQAETNADERSATQRTADAIAANTEAHAVIGETVGSRQDYVGVATVDNRMTTDATGAGGEAHVLAVAGEAGYGASADLRNGDVQAGASVHGRADLVGASGRAQLGSTNTAAGAGFVEGEARVGARVDAGAGGTLSLSRGEASLNAGVSGFAGAEVSATGGYENRWGGVSATARGQAGIGGTAQAELGYRDGNLRARVDLGAAVGLGGRVGIDVNVNVRNIASDAYSAGRSAVRGVGNAARSVGNWVSSWW
jgi:hypothetical protein